MGCDQRDLSPPAQSRVRSGTVTGKNGGRYARTLREFGLGAEDLAAWRESSLPDEAFEDWLIDRAARRPSRARARQAYSAEDIHAFARNAILDILVLGANDHLLEIGCGGVSCSATRLRATVTGVDHSEEMVELARGRAPGAEVVHATAEACHSPTGPSPASRCPSS